MHKDNIKYALSTEAFQSLGNLPYWPKGKHNFTYSFQLPKQLLAALNKQYPQQNFTQLFYSLTESMAHAVLVYLPHVANISFIKVTNYEVQIYIFYIPISTKLKKMLLAKLREYCHIVIKL